MTLPFSPRGGDNNKGGQANLPAFVGDKASKDYSLPFVHYLTIPKNTTKAAYLEYVMHLPVGTIKRLWIEFPPGCAGLAGIQIFRRIYQIFPMPQDVWFRSDAAVLNFAFVHSVHNEPYEVLLRGYNNDDTYDHTIWFAFEMTGLSEDLSPGMAKFLEALGSA